MNPCRNGAAIARCCCWLVALSALTTPTRADEVEQLASKKLLFWFVGKGSCLPYDMGVIKKASESIPALANNEVIVGGNSSGSILATYFACHGFGKASVDYAEYRMLNADVSAVRAMEGGPGKLLKLVSNQPTEISPNELREYIAFALGVNDWKPLKTIPEVVKQSKARPVLPLIIATANKEVLANQGTGGFLSERGEKEYNPVDGSVSWKSDAFAYYQRHPDEFARLYPDLVLGPDPYIGKACTLFVDPSMFALLSRLPNDERLCDLRLMTDAEDLAMAILASTAEPTYFPPVPETRVDRLVVDGQANSLGRSRRRTYCGGFAVPLGAQDCRRLIPSLRVASSGWVSHPLAVRRVVRAPYLLDLERMARLEFWWTDLDVTPPRSVQAEMEKRSLSAQAEFTAGYDRPPSASRPIGA